MPPLSLLNVAIQWRSLSVWLYPRLFLKCRASPSLTSPTPLCYVPVE